MENLRSLSPLEEKVLAIGKKVVKGHSVPAIAEACGVSNPTIRSFLAGKRVTSPIFKKISQGMSELEALPPSAKPKRRFFGRSDLASPPSQEDTVQEFSEPVESFKEEEMSEAPTQTPVRILGTSVRPPSPGQAGVRTDLKFSGEAEDVKRAANALGMPEGVPRGEARPEAVQNALDFWLKDGGTVVRVDRIRPREVARVVEPPAPTAIGKIIQKVEDQCGGGLFKIRAYPPDGRAPIQYQFDIPGAPTDIKEEPAKAEDAVKKTVSAAADAIDDEVRQLEAKKRKLIAERELEELKNPKEKAPPQPTITPEAIAAIIEKTVAARLEPLRQDRDRRELKDDILGSIAPALKELNAKIESAIPKQKSQELLILEGQLEQMRDQLEAIASSRGQVEEKDPLDNVSRIVRLIRELSGSPDGKPKDRSALIETALEEMLLQKLNGNGGRDPETGEKDEEDVLKFVVKEFAPAFRDYIHQEMEIKKQTHGVVSPQQQAANQAFLNQKVKEATAKVMDQMQQNRFQHQPQPQGGQPPRPQGAPQPAAPPPPPRPPTQAAPHPQVQHPVISIPASELEPNNDIPEQRDPRWVDETLRTLIREIGEGMPRECEWLGLVMDFMPETILDQFCDVETGDQLRAVLMPYADVRLLDEVQRLGKEKRIKTYIERGLMTIKDEWIRIKSGEAGPEEEPEQIEEEEPPRV